MKETDEARVERWISQSGVTLDEELEAFQVYLLKLNMSPERQIDGMPSAQRVNPAVARHLEILKSLKDRESRKKKR